MDFIGFEAEVDNSDDDDSFISTALSMVSWTYQKAFVNIMLSRMLR